MTAYKEIAGVKCQLLTIAGAVSCFLSDYFFFVV
jgi:hypothetical protein